MRLIHWLSEVKTGLPPRSKSILSKKRIRKQIGQHLERLEIRTLLVNTLQATIVGNDLVIEDVDGTGKNNVLSLSRSGTDLVISDANETFGTSIGGATLSNGDKTVTVPVSTPGLTGKIIVKGQGGNDSLSVDVSTVLGFDVDYQGGGAAVGDELILNITGRTSPTLTVNGFNAGVWTFGNAASVVYSNTETVNTAPTGTLYDLILDMEPTLTSADLSADTINVQKNGSNLEMSVDGAATFIGADADIKSLQVLGGNSTAGGNVPDDTLVIQETASGLPTFAGTSSTPGSHVSSTFTSLTGYNNTTVPVKLHFDGRGGTNALSYILTTSHGAVYTSDSSDTSKSGNVGIATDGTFATRQLGLSFENLAPLTFQGAGGSLVIDASSSPSADVTSLTVIGSGVDPVALLNAGTATDGASIVYPNAGSATFEPTLFSGFSDVSLRSGPGADTITLSSVDAATPAGPAGAQALTALMLDADNLGNTDNVADTLNVRSLPGAVTVTLKGGLGNDLFNIFDDNGTGGTSDDTVDSISGQVVISAAAGDEGGTDTLTVRDFADLTGDTVSITATTVDGIFDAGTGTDITFNNNIDVLTVDFTSGSGTASDTVNIDFGGVSNDLDTVTLNGNAGLDTFNIQSNTASAAQTQLNGNQNNDLYVFASGAVLRGGIDGGGGNDLVDWSAYSTARTISLSSLGATDGFTGTDASGTSSLTGSPGTFTNIDAVRGTSNSDTLIGANLRNHWDLGGNVAGFGPFGVAAVNLTNSLSNAGVLVADESDISLTGNASVIGRATGANPTTPSGGEQDLAWSGFENLTGALTSVDWFDFRNGASLSGNVNGRGGSDSLDYQDFSTAVNVNLNVGSATNLFGGAADGLVAGTGGDVGSSIENVFGGSANDSILGDGDNNILGDGFGSDTLDGASGNDTIRLEPGASTGGVGASSDVLTDITGSDTVDFRFAGAGVTIDMDRIGVPQDVLTGVTGLQNVSLNRTGSQTATMSSPFESAVGSQFNDVFYVAPIGADGNVPSLGVPVSRSLDGNNPPGGGDPVPPGDRYAFDGQGQVVNDPGTELSIAGLGSVTYASIETLTIFNAASRVLDNGDAGFELLPGPASWTTHPQGGTGYGGDAVKPATPQVGNIARWTFDRMTPGTYRLAATFPFDATQLAAASIRVYDDSRLLTGFSVDQLSTPGDFQQFGANWDDLGYFTLTSRKLVVELLDPGTVGKSITADAIRVERLSFDQPTPTQPEIRVQDASAYIADFTGSMPFNTTVGNALTKVVTVTNEAPVGGPNLVITAVDLGEGVGSAYSVLVAGGLPLVLNPGDSAPIVLTLNAATAGEFRDELRIFSNDPDEDVSVAEGSGVDASSAPTTADDRDPFTFTLAGRVTNGAIPDVVAVTVDGGTNVVDDTGIVSYPTTDLGQTVTKTFVVTNVGVVPLTLGATISVPAGFELVSDSGETSLAPAATRTFQLRYNAGSIGTISGNVSFATNDIDENPFNFQVVGTVSTVTIIDNGDAGYAEVGTWTGSIQGYLNDSRQHAPGGGTSTATWTFTALPAGFYQVSATWLENAGLNTATANYQITSSDGVQPIPVDQRFAPNDLTDGGSQWEHLGLPARVASAGGSLTITLSDSQAANLAIADAIRIERLVNAEIAVLDSTGGNALLADGAGRIDLGTATLGGAAVNRTIEIRNYGAAPLTIGQLTLPNGYTLISAPAAVLAAATGAGFSSTTFSVQLPTTTGGAFIGDVSLVSGDFNESPSTFILDGDVVTPATTFTYISTARTWAAAKAQAALDVPGGYLATIRSAAENAAAVTATGGSIAWIGGTDSVTEGVWLWDTGPDVGVQFWSGGAGGSAVGGEYTNWTGAEPNNTGNEDYLMMVGSNWNDLNGATALGYLVEAPNNSIVDDGDAGYSDTGWSASAAGYLGDQKEKPSGGADSATWTFTGLTPNSLYRVSATWQTIAGASTVAPFNTYDGSVAPVNLVGAVLVDQSVAPNDFTANSATWEDLGGSYRVGASGTLIVQLTNAASGTMLADAVRVEPVSAPEIGVVDNTTSANVMDGSGTISLGSVLVGSSTTRTFTIQNRGTSALSIGTPVLPYGYNLTTAPSASVANGGSTTFTIALRTDLPAGDYTGDIVIPNGDSDENSFNFRVSSTVNLASAIIDDGDAAYSDTGFTPEAVGFLGDTHTSAAGSGRTSTWTFNLASLGLPSGAGVVYRVSATWNPLGNRATNASFTVNGGAPVLINQQLAPNDFTAEGAAWEDLGYFFTSGGAITVQLSDTPADGVVAADAIRIERFSAPEIDVLQGTTRVTDAVTLLDLGTTQVGVPVQKTFTVTNLGAGTLTLGSVTLTAGFSLVGSPPTGPLAHGASSTFTVQLDATAAGDPVGILALANGDGTESPFEIALMGKVTNASLSATIVGSDLVIEDVDGTGKDNVLTLSRSGANIIISDASESLTTAIGGTALSNGGKTASIPASSLGVGGKIIIKGRGGSDTLTVDLTTDLGFDVDYQGGSGASDSLTLAADTVTSAAHSFTSANSGSITVVDGTTRIITYTGLEPITDNLTATDRVFTFTGGVEAVTVTSAAGAFARIDSTLGELVDFISPTGSLKIVTNGGDTTTINGFNAAFNAPSLILEDTTAASNFNLGASNVIPDATSLTLNGNAVFNLAGLSETINGLTGAGTVDNSVGAGTLTVGANGASTSFGGVVKNTVGTLGITKVGGGTLTLTNAGNTYLGTTNVNAGTLLVNGSNTGTGAVNVNNTATLGGSGTIAGSVTVAATAHLAPGNSPGIINTGSLAQNGILNVELAGNGGAGNNNGHDQVNVTGSVTINSATATLALDTTGLTAGEVTLGAEFTIINNNAGDAVVGAFNGLAEGATVVAHVAGSALDLIITYVGDSAVSGSASGNDVILRCVPAATVLLPPVSVEFRDGALSILGTGNADDITVQFSGANTVTLIANAGTTLIGPDISGQSAGPFFVTGDIRMELGNASDRILLLGVGGIGGTFGSGNIILDLGDGDDIVTTTDVVPPLTPTTGLILTGDLTIIGGPGNDTVSLGGAAAVDMLTVANLTIDTGESLGAQSITLNKVTVNGDASLSNGGNGPQTTTLTGAIGGSRVVGNLKINQSGTANTGGYLVAMADYNVSGDLTIANGNSTLAATGAMITITNTIAPIISGRAHISNGNNLANDINIDPISFAGDANFTNGDAPSNSIDLDDTTFTGSGATIIFTNGSGANNDINLGVTTTNTFAGQVFAFNNSAVAGTNDIRIPQGVFGRNVTVSNGLNAAAGVAVFNTVELATAGTGVDLTGNLVISNANTSGAGSNSVAIGSAATTATNGLRVVQVTPANGSGSGNVNIRNGTTATGVASVTIQGADASGTVAGSTHAIDGNLTVKNSGATAGGTKSINLSGLSTFGRTGATLNNAGAGDSTTNVGVVATVDPVFFNGTGGLFVQDGAGISTLNMQLATIGTLGTAKQIGFRYQDMGGGADTINVSTVAGSAVSVNGVTRFDTAGGSDIVTFTAPGSGAAAFNDSVFIALGAGDDTLNIGAFAASPAFGSASKFQFDGGQGVNTINASPLSVAAYTAGSVPKRLKSKITGFKSVN